MTWSALLLAAALLIGTGPVRSGIRPAEPTPVRPASDPLAAASCFDILSACLGAGMATPAAAAAAAALAPAELAERLTRAARLLALGADPGSAWAQAESASDPHGGSLARMARRSAESGAALAQGAAELADQVRSEAGAAAEAAAGRASVLIAGPLGLCFLPAFVCLGVVPVVAGLAGDVLGSGLL
ncbi:type II secretion system F family protein [Mycolicibacterium fluoranthenivorans]|jgi:pilus assembly protein TadC|uniref:Type II secretion system F family protein n=1 Tax=Mycolicibacterium fluoranthenivorans TaxID=258505 RepID=A0A7G8PF52_9MYCO|nr:MULTISPECIES: type II secretion system F family protein [Mycobacteriaceae]MCV7253825.1 type II secretion system F family protein [Mycobacterium hackensackense]QNJ92968.1 type II secretion system F family protein [Mycolicibacterium fluoranthenivorans]